MSELPCICFKKSVSHRFASLYNLKPLLKACFYRILSLPTMVAYHGKAGYFITFSIISINSNKSPIHLI